MSEPENHKYVPNTTSVTSYYVLQQFLDRGNEASATYDASYVSFRQLSLYYGLTIGMVNGSVFSIKLE